MGYLLKTEPCYGVDVLGAERHATYKLDRMYGKDYEHWTVEVSGPPEPVYMSVIRKPGSYGYEYGLYEIAFMEPCGLMDLFPEWGDQVLGYLSESDVLSWLEKALDIVEGGEDGR